VAAKKRKKPGKDAGADHTAPKARLRPAARFRNYFLAGILVTAPISITFWLTWKVIGFIDASVTPLIPPRWTPETYLPFAVPGFGLVIATVVLIFIGILATGFAGRLATTLSDQLVARVPVVRSIYSWTKQVFETVLSQRTSAFNEVVMVEYPSRGTWAIGFITGRTEGEVQDLTGETVYNVFVPATPNPTTGFLLFIPERDIRRLDLTIEEGIKLVISSGIVTPDSKDRRHSPANRAQAEHLEHHAGARPGIVRRLRNYFFAGILVTAPISITIWLAWEFVAYVDDRVTPLIPPSWNPETYLPFGLPGLGVVVVVLGLTMIGFITAGLIGRTLVHLGERILDRMPVVRSLYGAVKQIIETVFKEQSNAFREVVLIQYPRPESWAIGFITGQTDRHVQDLAPRQVVNVFLPTTPNPTSGFLLFVAREEIQELSMTIEEGIKMVVSGGIVTPVQRRDAPDEPEELDGGSPKAARNA
jgi:uncharacterized membrane protein